MTDEEKKELIERTIATAQEFDKLDEVTQAGIELQVAAVNHYKKMMEAKHELETCDSQGSGETA